MAIICTAAPRAQPVPPHHVLLCRVLPPPSTLRHISEAHCCSTKLFMHEFRYMILFSVIPHRRCVSRTQAGLLPPLLFSTSTCVYSCCYCILCPWRRENYCILYPYMCILVPSILNGHRGKTKKKHSALSKIVWPSSKSYTRYSVI